MNFVTFNQDFSCLAVGTRTGYRIYNCDPFGKVYEQKEGDISIIEMLFATSLVALILSPRRLVITNTKVSARSFLQLLALDLVPRRLKLTIGVAT